MREFGLLAAFREAHFVDGAEQRRFWPRTSRRGSSGTEPPARRALPDPKGPPDHRGPRAPLERAARKARPARRDRPEGWAADVYNGYSQPDQFTVHAICEQTSGS